jgi:hypothetical protein
MTRRSLACSQDPPCRGFGSPGPWPFCFSRVVKMRSMTVRAFGEQGLALVLLSCQLSLSACSYGTDVPVHTHRSVPVYPYTLDTSSHLAQPLSFRPNSSVSGWRDRHTAAPACVELI